MKTKSIFLIISILLLVVVLFFAINFFKPKSFLGDLSPCSNFSDIFSEARNNNNPQICKDIPDEQCSIACISQTAYLNHNETYCSLISDEYYKSSCYYQIGKSNKPEVCNLITTENQLEGFNYYCIKLHSSTTSNPLNKGGSLCASPTWKEECIISSGGCELLTNQKLKDICILYSRKSEFYAGSSQFECDSLILSESKRICNLAKEQKVGFVGVFTSENLEATCGNSICDLQESPITCPQDCKEGSGGCVVEGNFVTENSVGCCEGLVEETKVELKGKGEFICQDISKSYFPRTCIKPNDGICGAGENSCNSPSDCK